MRILARATFLLLCGVGVSGRLSGAVGFQRGDSNVDGQLTISDPSHLLSYLFLGGPAPTCLEASDANDDGRLDVSDGLWSLNFLFLGGPPPGAPFPDCGADPTPDELGCQAFAHCNRAPELPPIVPDPCDGADGPCRSAVLGPLTTVSRTGQDGVLRTRVEGAPVQLELQWLPADPGYVDLVFGLVEGPSLDPWRMEGQVPTPEEANLLATAILLLNRPIEAGAGARLLALGPSHNHAGCDPDEIMGIFNCMACGACCDGHDECIDINCKGPTDFADLRDCVLLELGYLDCVLGFDGKDCEALWPRCSAPCSGCHALVTACFVACVLYSWVPLESSCCERGDCGKEQQCIIDGVVETDPARCPGRQGTGWGDPHLVTFDRLAYDLQLVGELVLTRTVAKDLEVQVRAAPYRGSRHVSTMNAVAMRVGGDRVGVYLGRTPGVLVNGAPVELGSDPLELPGGGRVVSRGGVVVTAPGGDEVSVLTRSGYLDVFVRVGAARAGSLEGLLGDSDGRRDNDLRIRGGDLIGVKPAFTTLYREFGDSWRVTPEESLFDYLPGETTGTFTDLAFPEGPTSAAELPAAAREAAEAACRAAGVTDPAVLEACILDVGLSGETSFAAGAAEAISGEESVGPPPCDAPQVEWVDWTAFTSSTVDGSVAGRTVAFRGDVTNAFVSGGLNYWGSFSSTYTKAGIVPDPPPASDIIALTGGPTTGVQTLTFSSPVLDPVMAVLSLGRPGAPATYDFDQPFEILNVGPGYFGNGTLTQLEGDVLQGAEGHGLIQFHGLVSSISWTMPSAEFWHAIQVGVSSCGG